MSVFNPLNWFRDHAVGFTGTDAGGSEGDSNDTVGAEDAGELVRGKAPVSHWSDPISCENELKKWFKFGTEYHLSYT